MLKRSGTYGEMRLQCRFPEGGILDDKRQATGARQTEQPDRPLEKTYDGSRSGGQQRRVEPGCSNIRWALCKGWKTIQDFSETLVKRNFSATLHHSRAAVCGRHRALDDEAFGAVLKSTKSLLATLQT